MLVDDVGGDNINNKLNDSSICSSEWRSNEVLMVCGVMYVKQQMHHLFQVSIDRLTPMSRQIA